MRFDYYHYHQYYYLLPLPLLPMNAECKHCGYDWEYTGSLAQATCPSCGRKTSVENKGRDDYRTKGLAAKGRQCQECGTDQNIVVHHIDGDRSNNSLDNLIPLCQDCHAAVHARDDDHQELAEQLPDSPYPPGGSLSADEISAIADAIRTHPDPIVTASGLADIFDCSRRHILDQLRLLEHAGEVRSKQTGARAVAWWHSDRVLPPPENERDERIPEPEPDPEPSTDPTNEIAQTVDAAAANWEDSPQRIDARKAAARAVLSALRERPLSKSEIIEEFYPEFPVNGQSKRTWWRKNLAEGPGAPIKEVAEYNRGTQKWEMMS